MPSPLNFGFLGKGDAAPGGPGAQALAIKFVLCDVFSLKTGRTQGRLPHRSLEPVQIPLG